MRRAAGSPVPLLPLLAVLGALVGGIGGSAAADDVEAARYRELRRVIDRNVGDAHMTRGANMYTVIALRECVSERDIPLLGRMLQDRDHVTQLAVARVLTDFGEPGLAALRGARSATREARTRGVIDDALAYAGQPEHRQLGQYPLTPDERRRIRGCARR